MRRDPLAILTAHKMDPDRRELYVEGNKDKLFLQWIAGADISPRATVILIDFVEMPGHAHGGNRARLLAFLRFVENDPAIIRGLIDSDSDGLTQPPPSYPSNVWVTDWRSLESYVLTEECLDVALKIGCDIDSIKAKALFREIIRVARTISAIRYVSESENLKLPVSNYKWLKYVKCHPNGIIVLDIQGVLTSLLQVAGISLSRRAEVQQMVSEAEVYFEELDDLHVVHGKDFMKILTAQLKVAGVNIDDAGRLLWTAFRRENAMNHATLSEVVDFLSVDGSWAA